MRVRRTRKALRDIDAAYLYLRLRDAAAAERFLGSIEETVANIQVFPKSGSLRAQYSVGAQGLRVVRVKGFRHQLYYQVFDTYVRIVRVLAPGVEPSTVLTPPDG